MRLHLFRSNTGVLDVTMLGHSDDGSRTKLLPLRRPPRRRLLKGPSRGRCAGSAWGLVGDDPWVNEVEGGDPTTPARAPGPALRRRTAHDPVSLNDPPLASTDKPTCRFPF